MSLCSSRKEGRGNGAFFVHDSENGKLSECWGECGRDETALPSSRKGEARVVVNKSRNS